MNGERVLEINYGEYQGQELSQCYYQSDGERTAFRGQYKHRADTHVSENVIKENTL